jgi:hypothetical protein
VKIQRPDRKKDATDAKIGDMTAVDDESRVRKVFAIGFDNCEGSCSRDLQSHKRQHNATLCFVVTSTHLSPRPPSPSNKLIGRRDVNLLQYMLIFF